MSQSITKGSDFSRIARHGAVYFVASLLTKGLHAILLPVYTTWLSPSDYATFSNLFAIAGLIVVATSLYLDNAYARFYFDECEEPTKLRALFSTLFIFTSVWGAIVASILFFLLAPYLTAAYSIPALPYVAVVCVIPLFAQFNALARTHFRSQHRSGLVTSATYILAIVNAAIALTILIGIKATPAALLWGVLAGEAASAAYLLYKLFQDGLIAFTIDRPQLRSALSYSIGLIPLTAASWLSGYSDRLLITWLGDANASGIYSVAFEIGRVINIFVLAIFMVYGPMMFALLKEDKPENILRIERFQSVFIHLLVGSAFFLSLFAPEFYRLFINASYNEGIPWVAILAASFVFAGLRKLYATPIYYQKLTIMISIGGIAQAALNFGINYALIPKYGAAVAAWSKLVSMAAVALFFYLLCRKYQPIRMNRRALGITFSTLTAGTIGYLLARYGLQLEGNGLLAAKLLILAGTLIATWASPFGGSLRSMIAESKKRLDRRDENLSEALDNSEQTN